MKNNRRNRRGIRWSRVLIWLCAIVLTAAAILLLLHLIPEDDIDVDALLEETANFIIETEAEETETEEAVNVVPQPDIDVQLLTVNDWSRPGIEVDSIEKIVVHYIGNPMTTAQNNHDYFESLKDQGVNQVAEEDIVYMSANFMIGLEGEIIECVPPGEVAWASNSANYYSVSIENCHPDETGEFTEATYESLVHLTAWLLEEYGLERDDIIRHYDVTGKFCPLYYVENEDKWEEFKDDVMAYIEECRLAAE